MTRVAAVLGWPVAHSRSPAIMNAAFAATGIDARMVALAVPPDQLAGEVVRLRALSMLGASVTVPHKLAVVTSCDQLASSARLAGAVNCLEFAGGQIVGHNTDIAGFHDGLTAAGFDPSGKRVVLLGAGGAARAVRHAFPPGTSVEAVARRPDDVEWIVAHPWTDAELRTAFARADLVVDCTSAGLDPEADTGFAEALPLDVLATGAWIGTLVYHRRTRLLERAAALGHRTFDGGGMLVHQAARAFQIWTGREAPLDVMHRALDVGA